MSKFLRGPAALSILVGIFILAFLFGGPESAIDVGAIHRLMALRVEHPQFTSFVVVLTQLGSAYATLGLGAVVAATLFYRGERERAKLLGAIVVGERLVMDSLKIIVGRPRPALDIHPVMTHSSSFPSGHSANTMAVFLAIAVIAAPRAYRRSAVLFAIVMSLIIGTSRPFLGVHWPSDVIGGWMLGLMAVWTALRVGRRSGVLVKPKHEVVGGHVPPVGKDEAA